MADLNAPTSPVSRQETAKRAIGLLDLTSLGDHDEDADIVALCQRAPTPHGSVAAVCIWPRFVPLAIEQLRSLGADDQIQVSAVANFPAGDNDPALAVADARRIVDGGGHEVDVVIPWRALAAGEHGVSRELVAAVREAIGDTVTLKAILESGELVKPELIARAGVEALDGGADFLKTSTGKTEHSASIEAASVLLQVIAERTGTARPGLKISGGVRDLDTAASYLALADDVMGQGWATPATFRFGASGLLDDLLAELANPTS